MSNLTIDAADVVGAAKRVDVSVQLTDADGVPVLGYITGTDDVVVRSKHTKTAADGTLTLDLTPNASITPANTYYTVTVGNFSCLIEKGAATETLLDALTSSPSALDSTALATHLADTVDAHDASAISFSPTGSIAATTVQAAIQEVRDEAGGGAVASVNGHTGTVVLSASDVGADASGAAAAAQAAAVAASQPLDSDLTAIAALSTTTYGRAFLALADAAAGRTALGLGTAATSDTTAFDAAGAAASAQSAAATDATTKANAAQAAAIAASQPLDSDLTAIAALSTTTFGRALLALADAAALRTAAGLGSLATLSMITTTEITDGTVANSDLADMAAKTVKMRHTNSTGAPEDTSMANLMGDLSASAAADFSMNSHKITAVTAGAAANEAAIYDQTPAGLVTAAGDLVVGTGSHTVTNLAKGTALQVLRTNAGATALEWATPSGGGGASIYGDGQDGNLTVSGTTTIATDKYYDTLTVQNGGVLKVAGARIFCKTLCQVDAGGVIHANGNDGAAGGTAGAATSQGMLGAEASGGAGGTGAGSVSPTHSNAYGGNGGAGGAGSGGAGGAASGYTSLFGNYGCQVPRWGAAVMLGHYSIDAVSTVVAKGGGGGGGGGGDGTAGGGGGSGGGAFVLAAKSLTNNGTISANGGDGGSPAAGNRGGGGGGGGGYIGIVYDTKTGSGTITATAGTGGTHTGTGADGSSGSAGTVTQVVNV